MTAGSPPEGDFRFAARGERLGDGEAKGLLAPFCNLSFFSALLVRLNP